MDEKVQSIIRAMMELRTASINATESNLRATMEKYDMLFLGERFNIINTIELRHSLETKFGIQISMEALISLIPSICQYLDMKYEGMINLKDAGQPNPQVSTYNITLYR